jgi:hypothetical protein
LDIFLVQDILIGFFFSLYCLVAASVVSLAASVAPAFISALFIFNISTLMEDETALGPGPILYPSMMVVLALVGAANSAASARLASNALKHLFEEVPAAEEEENDDQGQKSLEEAAQV